MRKNAIAGVIIGVIVGLTVIAYSETFTYNITGKIVIPKDVDVSITGFTEDYWGNLVLPDIILTDNTGETRLGITNQGSATLTITWTATTDTAHLTIDLEGYIEYTSTGDAFGDSNTCTLDRGKFMDCVLIVTDDGETPTGDHEFTLTIDVTG